MKTVVLKKIGGPDSVSVVELEEPKLEAQDSIKIRISFCALSLTDIEIREGCNKHLQVKLYAEGEQKAFIPGFEIVGRVVDIGNQVDRFSVGDEVAAIIPSDLGGGCAEFVCIPHYYAVKRPPSISAEKACSVLGPGLRAILCFRRLLRPEPGESIMIINPTTDVGRIAVQFSLHLKLRIMCVFFGDKQLFQTFENEFQDRLKCVWHKGLYSSTIKFSASGFDCIFETLTPTTLPSQDGPYTTSADSRSVEVAELIDCMAYGARWAVADKNLQLDPPNASALHARNAILGFSHEQALLHSGTRVSELISSMNQLMTYLDPLPDVKEISFVSSPLMVPQTCDTPTKSPSFGLHLSFPDPRIFTSADISSAHDAVWSSRDGNLDYGRILVKLQAS